jgi:hypothetical protein
VYDADGRAPRPLRGDPNEKELSLLLATDDWRKLRLWAAQEMLSVEEIVSRIVRGALEERPPVSVR